MLSCCLIAGPMAIVPSGCAFSSRMGPVCRIRVSGPAGDRHLAYPSAIDDDGSRWIRDRRAARETGLRYAQGPAAPET